MARGITLSRGRASGFDLPRAEEEVVSLASSFDRDKETFEPRIPVREEKRPTSTSSPSLTLAGVPEYNTPEESLNNLASFVEQQQGQSSALSAAAVESGDYSGIKGEDVNKLRQDPRNVRDYYTESVDTNIVDFVEDNDIPLFKEVNGQKLYLNTGTSGSIAGIAKEGSDVVYQAYGPVGTYSTVAVPKDRSISGAFPPILRTALAAFTGGASEAVLSAANAAAGQTLTTADWLNLAAGAVQLYNSSGGFTASSGSPITGTTAPRTLSEMAEAGDIISLTVGGGSIAEDALEDDDSAAVRAAIESAEQAKRDAEAKRQAEESARAAAEAEAKRAAEESARAAAEAKRREEEQAAAEAARAAAQAAADQAEEDRIAAERAAQAEADAAAALEQERLAKEAEAERQRQQQIADEQAEAARVAEEARITAERAAQAEAERQAAAAAEAQRRAEAARVAEEARIAAEQAEADRLAAEAEAKRQTEVTVTDGDGEVVDITGDVPETTRVGEEVDLEFEEVDITADPIEVELDIEQPEVEQPEQQPVQQPSDSNGGGGGGGGGADTGGGETGAGSSGTGIPEEGSGIPGTSGSGGIAQEEGYDPDPLPETMSVPNPDFDPESRDVLLQRQIYDMILRETDPVLRERLEQEYERMGGNHLEEVRAGVPIEEVYADYPPEYIEAPYEEATLDEETFEARYPDGWLGGSFDTLDANKDGVVSDTELSDYEHNMGSGQGGEPSNIVKEILDALRLEVDTPDPSTGLPTDTTVEVGTAAGPTDPAVGTGQDPSTDLSTGIPSDTAATGGTTGAGGAGVGTDVGGGAGGGTGDRRLQDTPAGRKCHAG